MTYDSELLKTELSELPELYDFESAGESIGRFTSYLKPITFKGLTYTPAPLKRSNVTTDAAFSAPSVTITAPVLDLMTRYIASRPLEPVTVTITRVVAKDTSLAVVLFKGRIKTVSMQDRVVSAVCEGGSSVLTSRYPNLLFQSGCNHAVFDDGCGLTKDTWAVHGTVSAVAGGNVFSSIFTANPGFFSLGILVSGDSASMITGHEAGYVSLHSPLAGLSAGSTITVYPGCDGSPATCKNKFNNFNHFLGFTCIPSSNPVIWGL